MLQSRNAIRLARLTTLAIASAIVFATLLPMPHLPGPPNADKGGHSLAFLLLMLPLALTTPRALFWLAPLALAFGGLIEIVQPHVGRSRELADLIADGTGIAAGCVIALAVAWWRRTRA